MFSAPSYPPLFARFFRPLIKGPLRFGLLNENVLPIEPFQMRRLSQAVGYSTA